MLSSGIISVKYSHYVCFRWSKKKKAGTQVWYGRATDDLPYRKLGPLDPEIFASYSGPDVGMSLVPQLDQQIPASPKNGKYTCFFLIIFIVQSSKHQVI